MSKRNLRARRLAKAKLAKKETKGVMVFGPGPSAPSSIGKEEKLVPILQLDVDFLEVIEEFESVDHAIEELELNQPNLLRALKGKTKYKGFYWDFK